MKCRLLDEEGAAVVIVSSDVRQVTRKVIWKVTTKVSCGGNEGVENPRK